MPYNKALILQLIVKFNKYENDNNQCKKDYTRQTRCRNGKGNSIDAHLLTGNLNIFYSIRSLSFQRSCSL